MPQVDYDALAKQHGGAPVIDYDALAQSLGGKAATSPPSPQDAPRGPSEDAGAFGFGFAKRLGSQAVQAIDAWGRVGPHAVRLGLEDVGRGNYAKGARQVLSGAAMTAAPMLAPQMLGAFAAAPVASTLTAGTGIAAGITGQQAGTAAARALGATEDQAGLVGDVAGLATGFGAASLAGKTGRAVAARAEPALREGASRKVLQALGPTKERYKAMAIRITPEILKRGLGGSREQLLAKAQASAETAGQAIDDAIQVYGQRQVGTQPVVGALETAKNAFRTVGRDGAMVEFEPRAIRQLEKLQQIVSDLGDRSSVDQLVAVRRAWDTVVDQAGGFAHRAGGAIGIPLKEQTEAWAKREATGAIRKVLAADVPELAAVNKEYAFWKNLQGVLTQTLQRTAPQSSGLSQAAAEATGAIMGSGRGLGSAWATAKAAKLAHQVFTSPRWRLLDARMRNRLADAIATGSGAQVEGALASVAAAQRRPVAGELGPGARPMPAAPDTSFVRGVPAMRSYSERPMLPPGRRITPLPGDIQVDTSSVRTVPAATLAHEVNATVPVKQGGVRVSQYSGDPAAKSVDVVTPEVRPVLKRMLDDLETFEPLRGRLVRDPQDPNASIYTYGTAGSAVGDDVRVISEQSVSNREIQQAIKDLLKGKKPTNRLHTAALDAAQGYLEKRPGYRGPVVPGEGDDGFEAFSRSVDEIRRK